jgi:predicted nuclease of predicted toxin-antitoxin system
LKFLVDMPVTPQAVPHLEGRGHEAAHASNVGLATEPDSALLEHARRHAQVVITADLDFPRLLATHKAETPGVILFRGGSYSDAKMLALLDRVLDRVSDHDLQHSITIVDRSRIRVHRLPVAAP